MPKLDPDRTYLLGAHKHRVAVPQGNLSGHNLLRREGRHLGRPRRLLPARTPTSGQATASCLLGCAPESLRRLPCPPARGTAHRQQTGCWRKYRYLPASRRTDPSDLRTRPCHTRTHRSAQPSVERGDEHRAGWRTDCVTGQGEHLWQLLAFLQIERVGNFLKSREPGVHREEAVDLFNCVETVPFPLQSLVRRGGLAVKDMVPNHDVLAILPYLLVAKVSRPHQGQRVHAGSAARSVTAGDGCDSRQRGHAHGVPDQ
eukprot:scaffold7095_cov386-Prasinococcus_capsulatus_cf.AAC.11